MKPVYIQEYIWRVVRDLSNDKNFISQGIQNYYDEASQKDRIALQWLMAEYSQQTDLLTNKLKEVESMLDKINKKENNGDNTRVLSKE